MDDEVRSGVPQDSDADGKKFPGWLDGTGPKKTAYAYVDSIDYPAQQ